MPGYSRAFTGTHCAYPWRDGQAELTWDPGWLVIHGDGLPARITHPGTNRARCSAPTPIISVSSAYPLLPSQVVSVYNLQRLALYWFHAPGLQLDNEVSQSTDQPHGTVCHQHYSHWTCRRVPSSGHQRRTCSRPPGATETFSWFWAGYKYPDLLTHH